MGESASRFTGGGHGWTIMTLKTKVLFVLQSSWRLNSVHSGAESHITVLGGSKVNPARDSAGRSEISCIIHAFTPS